MDVSCRPRVMAWGFLCGMLKLAGRLSEVWHLLVALFGGAAIDLAGGTLDWHSRPVAGVCLCLCSDGAFEKRAWTCSLRGALQSCSRACGAISHLGSALALQESKTYKVPVALNVLVGVAAPLLWTAQNAYVGRSACAAAELQQEPAEKWTTSSSAKRFDRFTSSI